MDLRARCRITVKQACAVIAVFTAVIYGGAIVWGLHLGSRFFVAKTASRDIATLSGAHGDLVRQGRSIFVDTPGYAAAYTGGRLSCESCHAAAGTQPFAAPMTGVVQRFPQFNQRAGRVISVQDRVRECFVRSENGKPPADDSEVMRAVVAYLEWLSPMGEKGPVVGVGFEKLPVVTGDPQHGAEVFAAQCAGCHGAQGQGRNRDAWPPLWGPDSFNDGAGMYRVTTMAAFIQHNMPQNRMGILTTQDAYDVAAFVHQQARPVMNPEYKKY